MMKKILFYDNKNIISNSLKLSRIEKNMTQGALAAKMQTMGVNIDQQMISRIESNDRFVTDYELVCFCKALGVSIQDIIKDSPEFREN